MKENPSDVTGDDLPVTNISYLDAIEYANKKSEAAKLIPVYTIDDKTITYRREANGYRLPTEAEWEYACRENTTTPFNSEHSLSAKRGEFLWPLSL